MLALVLLLASQASGIPSAGPDPNCWDSALTQAAMNECADAEFAAADKEMASVYQRLMRTPDATFKAKLREAQRAWLKFRDAHVESIYPDPQHRWYGSVRPMCVAILLKELTVERTKQLKTFLETPEGDVCSPPGPQEDSSP